MKKNRNYERIAIVLMAIVTIIQAIQIGNLQSKVEEQERTIELTMDNVGIIISDNEKV